MGDYNHHRASINIHTLQFGLQALEKLSANFDTVYFIPGNHDLYYRDRRDIHSVEWAKHLPNVKIINDFFQQGDVVIAPWLVQDDYKKLQKMGGKYMFGHFELPNFFMNAMVEMPDTGELRPSDFKKQEYVFSGHFHKRQVKNNIHYLGNPFPHNYADVDDDDRGMMILEHGTEPVYFNWDNCPKYRNVKLSTLLDKTKEIMKKKMHLRVTLDIDISFEEASYIKETFMKEYDCREITLIPSKQEEEINTELDITKFESVDQIVSKEIETIESDAYDKSVLLRIFRDLNNDTD